MDTDTFRSWILHFRRFTRKAQEWGSDLAWFKQHYACLPLLLQEDLFHFFLYYVFEDFVVSGHQPVEYNNFINFDRSYLSYYYEEPDLTRGKAKLPEKKWLLGKVHYP